jgi:hypothetical protein
VEVFEFLITYVQMICFVVQTMLSRRGYDIPLGRTTVERAARQEVFDIIAPYFLSAEGLQTVEQADQEEVALWLETFTNTQKGLLYTSLNILAKEHCITTSFPPNGAIPPPHHAAQLGLPAGKSFLSR